MGLGRAGVQWILESDVRKAQVNKELVLAVFFDVEKAYAMLWKEGLPMKLDALGVGGRVYNWIKDAQVTWAEHINRVKG